MLEDAKKGKIEIAMSKRERDQQSSLNALKQEKKAKGRKRDGPSAFYYEDENRVDLSVHMIQQFGSLELSPPTEFD